MGGTSSENLADQGQNSGGNQNNGNASHGIDGEKGPSYLNLDRVPQETPRSLSISNNSGNDLEFLSNPSNPKISLGLGQGLITKIKGHSAQIEAFLNFSLVGEKK